MKGAWIEGNAGFRISAICLVQVTFVFPFIVVLVAQIIDLWISGGRESPRCGSGPPTTSFRRRRGGGAAPGVPGVDASFPMQEAASPSAGVRLTSLSSILERMGQFALW